jgi:hypothetical protein
MSKKSKSLFEAKTVQQPARQRHMVLRDPNGGSEVQPAEDNP